MLKFDKVTADYKAVPFFSDTVYILSQRRGSDSSVVDEWRFPWELTRDFFMDSPIGPNAASDN